MWFLDTVNNLQVRFETKVKSRSTSENEWCLSHPCPFYAGLLDTLLNMALHPALHTLGKVIAKRCAKAFSTVKAIINNRK